MRRKNNYFIFKVIFITRPEFVTQLLNKPYFRPMIGASELVVNPNGSVYHLGLQPGEIADDVFLVGDPGRVDTVISRFDSVEFIREKREFRSATGRIGNKRVSVISTGIGTDNIDIVLTELDALFNLDLEKRELRQSLKSLRIMRLGTCGGLQPEVPLGALVFSDFALGLDSLMHYYHYPLSKETADLEHKFNQYISGLTVLRFPIYAAEADVTFRAKAQQSENLFSGITLTAPGFYGPQGRYIQRAAPLEPRLPEIAAAFRWQGKKCLNLEMETSAILAFGQILKHQTASLCTVLANRTEGTFHPHPEKAVSHLIDEGFKLMGF